MVEGMVEKVLVKIQHFSDEALTAPDLLDDSLEFKGEGLEMLKEIHPDPKKAIILALQIATKLKRFDTDSHGNFTVQSQRMKGKFEVREWK